MHAVQLKMSSRKRNTPLHLDQIIAAKVQCQRSSPPREATIDDPQYVTNASADSAAIPMDHMHTNHPQLPQSPVIQSTATGDHGNQQVRRKKRKRTAVKPKLKVLEPLPPVRLSPNVIASISSLSTPVQDGCGLGMSVISIFHPYMCNRVDLIKILKSRAATFEEVASGCVPEDSPVEESGGRYVLIGTLQCELEGSLDLRGVFKDGCQSICLGLVLEKSENKEKTRWLFKLSVCEEVWYLPVKMDSRLAIVPFDELERSFISTSSLLKLFLPHDMSDGSTATLQLEVWATERLSNCDVPSDANWKVQSGFRMTGKKIEEAIYLFVRTLYPEYALERGEDFSQGLCGGISPVQNGCLSPYMQEGKLAVRGGDM